MALERNLPGKTLEEIMQEVANGEVDMTGPLGNMQTLPEAGPEVDASVASDSTWVEIETDTTEGTEDQ